MSKKTEWNKKDEIIGSAASILIPSFKDNYSIYNYRRIGQFILCVTLTLEFIKKNNN